MRYILLTAILFITCAGSTSVQDAVDALAKKKAAREDFDPAGLKDTFVVPEPVLQNTSGVEFKELTQTSTFDTVEVFVEDSNLTVSGFRLQLFSSTSLTRSNEFFELLKLKILNENAYLTFDQPFYKVRLGNFLSRNAAEEFKNTIIRDYPNAWIVRTDIFPYIVSPSILFNDSLIYNLDTLAVDSIGTITNPDSTHR